VPRGYPELAWLLIPSQVSSDVIALKDAEPATAATCVEMDVKGASASATGSSMECQICLEKPPSAAYVPCGHSGAHDSAFDLHLFLFFARIRAYGLCACIFAVFRNCQDW
jgi:hypothetical protein